MMPKSSYLLAEAPEVDLAVASAMAQELERYLTQDELYWTLIVRVEGRERSLKMTGGDLLTRLHRLQHMRDQLSAWQNERLDEAQKLVNEMSYSLRTRFHQRLQREAKARLGSLRWFLDDCPADPPRCRVEFPFEMRNRQRIEEIVKVLGDELDDELKGQLDAIDRQIRLLSRPVQFIWHKVLEPIFPRTPYWYLYIRP
ncbi:MAG: hypothetical protein R2911_17015 [Caldilineaceae bacterium]